MEIFRQFGMCNSGITIISNYPLEKLDEVGTIRRFETRTLDRGESETRVRIFIPPFSFHSLRLASPTPSRYSTLRTPPSLAYTKRTNYLFIFRRRDSHSSVRRFCLFFLSSSSSSSSSLDTRYHRRCVVVFASPPVTRRPLPCSRLPGLLGASRKRSRPLPVDSTRTPNFQLSCSNQQLASRTIGTKTYEATTRTRLDSRRSIRFVYTPVLYDVFHFRVRTPRHTTPPPLPILIYSSIRFEIRNIRISFASVSSLVSRLLPSVRCCVSPRCSLLGRMPRRRSFKCVLSWLAGVFAFAF